MPTTRRSKRARADTNGDAVDPLSSGVEAEPLKCATETDTRVNEEGVAHQASRKEALYRKKGRKETLPPTKKAAPTKKTPRIVVRNTTEMPSEIPESEYNVEEAERPARVQQRQPKLIIRGSSVISESQSGIDGVIVDPFNGDDDVDDDIVFTGAQSKPHNPPRPTTKTTARLPPARQSDSPPPPPLPKSIFVKIQRDVKWFRSQYLSTFKIAPPVPSRYLRRHAIKVEVTDVEITEPFDGLHLERAAEPSYITLVEDVRLLARKAGLEGSVAHTACEVRLSKVAGPRKQSDIAMFNIAPRSPSSISRIDFDSLMSQMIEAGGTEFVLTLEFEFDLEPPVNNDDLVVAASPTPIRGFSTLVLPTSRPSRSRLGRAGAQLPRGISATPISNRGTPKAPSTRKSTSNTMAEEMYRRYEADIAKSRTEEVVNTRLVFNELHFRWKCDLGSKCKNFHNGAPATWCWREQGGQKHYPLTSQDIQVWATAIRDGKTTKDNPPVQFHRKWREVVEQQQQQQQQQAVEQSGIQPWPVTGRIPRGARHTMMPTFHVNINNNNTGPGDPPGTTWGPSNPSYPPPSTATIADPPLPQ
ncbi:predicted protein [Chaetomium globosum CBS 148.51]|uniref:Uncharacterized protein n=1 Tax=Chaetomium globosum (strain ATCC 6205 / CBS 148.51 / DSM 1962 / NBRC 6347 / NRRL 1970) TaxID=306901 RepID=Q2H5M2_CHAGB|nr:uncharacterized protein CHGG_06043 [Chaetomium globosum CBS 148.51]EAQ89424.1 predicted protein [Chaetomium globosum CBS 148.51]